MKKTVIDVLYNGHIIDAKYVEIERPKSGPAFVEIDLTEAINQQINLAIQPRKPPPPPRKDLDTDET